MVVEADRGRDGGDGAKARVMGSVRATTIGARERLWKTRASGTFSQATTSMVNLCLFFFLILFFILSISLSSLFLSVSLSHFLSVSLSHSFSPPSTDALRLGSPPTVPAETRTEMHW